jgi:predicted transcriptional regulator
MVICMAQRKVTLSLPDDTVAAAQEAARQAHTSFSAYVSRALRNETLRRQLEAAPLIGDTEWLDDIEADEETNAA